MATTRPVMTTSDEVVLLDVGKLQPEKDHGRTHTCNAEGEHIVDSKPLRIGDTQWQRSRCGDDVESTSCIIMDNIDIAALPEPYSAPPPTLAPAAAR